MIDYERAKRMNPKLKAMLTRALNQTDAVTRKAAVIVACSTAVHEWILWGGWPDDWSRWQRALDDTRGNAVWVNLESL